MSRPGGRRPAVFLSMKKLIKYGEAAGKTIEQVNICYDRAAVIFTDGTALAFELDDDRCKGCPDICASTAIDIANSDNVQLGLISQAEYDAARASR